MFFKKKKRFMVIGIDGVTYELVKDFAQKGIMPNAKKLIEKYGLIKTKVPLPEVSSVSWTSFMTGMNSGEHGIYGFMEIHRDNYSYTFPSFRNLPVKPVWEEIGSRKKRAIIINLPNIYPARPLNGILIAGFVAPDLEDENPKNIKSMTGKTKIFALDPSRLYIHLESKYKRGRVKKEEYHSLREEIRAKFLDLEIEGEKVIKDVFYKEDIYYGKYLEHAPDLVLLSNYGFDLKSGVTKSSHYDKTFFEGMHSWDNALLIDSYGFDLKEHPYIYDIGKKIKEFF